MPVFSRSKKLLSCSFFWKDLQSLELCVLIHRWLYSFCSLHWQQYSYSLQTFSYLAKWLAYETMYTPIYRFLCFLWSKMIGNFCLFADLIMMFAYVRSQSPVFLVHPVSVAAIDGTIVEFSCTAQNAEEIIYRVNGSSAALQDVERKGFLQLKSEVIDGTQQRRNLTVTVSSQYNNTEIFCTAIGTGMNENSKTANLTVQGLLSLLVDLSFVYIGSSIVNISWSPPFTLPGTAIIGYNILVTSNGTTTNYFTSDSYYVLQLHNITDSPCNDINITVSGYNGLEGEHYLIPGLYIHSVPSIDNVVPVSVEIINSQLRFLVNVTDLCIGVRPSDIGVKLLSDDILVNMVDDVTLLQHTDHNVLYVNTTLTILENQIYTALVTFSNLGGEFNTISTVNFTTFGVQSAVITDSTGGRLCLACCFSSFSTDTGCTVELVSSGSVQYTETFYRSGNTAKGCVSGVTIGQYDARIYDQDNDMVVLTLSGVNVTNNITTSTGASSASLSASSAFFTSSLSVSGTSSSTHSTLELTTKPKSDDQITIYIAVPIGAVIFVVIIIVLLVLLCVMLKKKKCNGRQDRSSDIMANLAEISTENDKTTETEFNGDDVQQISHDNVNHSSPMFIHPKHREEKTSHSETDDEGPESGDDTQTNPLLYQKSKSNKKKLGYHPRSCPSRSHSCVVKENPRRYSDGDAEDRNFVNIFSHEKSDTRVLQNQKIPPHAEVYVASKDRPKAHLTESIYSVVDHNKTAQLSSGPSSKKLPPVP